jgi:SAM-dependent methyltransferase
MANELGIPLMTLEPGKMVSGSRQDVKGGRYRPEDVSGGWLLKHAAMGQCYDVDLPCVLYPPGETAESRWLQSSDLVSQLIGDRGHVAIADFGYGTGGPLNWATDRPEWKEHITCYAVGFSQLARGCVRRDGTSTYQALVGKGVAFVEKSLTALRQGDLPPLDLIVCRNVLPYIVNYPQWECVRKMYHFLKKGGYLLLSGFGFYWDEEQGQNVPDPLVREEPGRGHWKRYLEKLGELGHTFALVDDLSCKAGLMAYRGSSGRLPPNTGIYVRPPDRLFNVSSLSQKRLQREQPERSIGALQKAAYRVAAKVHGEL